MTPPYRAIAAFYRHPAVRARIAEYCGGHDRFPSRFCAEGLAGFGGARGLHGPDMAPVPVGRGELWRLFDDGADVCRALADRGGTLIQLDVDYVNPEDAGEPARDPATCFARLEPVYHAVREVLAEFGVPTLALMTGRGYHFTARAPLGSALHSDLITLARLSAPLQARYERETAHEPRALSMGAAHEGAGRLVEYLAHEVMRAVHGRTAIPVTAADVPPPGRGPFVCLDLSAYGDPLWSRYARCAFSSHQKAKGPESDPGFVIALPRTTDDLRELLATRRSPEAAIALAARQSVHIPDVAVATRWVRAYRASPLARFQARFDAAASRRPAGDVAELETGLPNCVGRALRNPNPALLVPTALRALTLVLWGRGADPSQVADLVRARYEADCGWGDLWSRYEPAARADFYVRLFTGLVVDGLDGASDFTCASQQQRGGCPGGECGQELRALFPAPEQVQEMGAAT